MKNLEELIKGGSVWADVEELMQSAVNEYEILPKNTAKADEVLVNMQIPLDSHMGSLVYETGGILVDGGWLRVIGSGSDKLKRDLYDWNIGRSYDENEEPGFTMIADDVLGGIFAINLGELGDDIGALYYLAPDTVDWEPLEVDYKGFLEFCFLGAFDEFYGNCKWKGYEDELKNISGDEAFMVIPPLWAEGAEDIAERERQVISMDEMFAVLVEASEYLSGEFDFDDEDDDETMLEYDESYEGHHGCGGCHCGDSGCNCEDDDDDCECGCDGDDCGCGHDND